MCYLDLVLTLAFWLMQTFHIKHLARSDKPPSQGVSDVYRDLWPLALFSAPPGCLCQACISLAPLLPLPPTQVVVSYCIQPQIPPLFEKSWLA